MKRYVHLFLVGLLLTSSSVIFSPRLDATDIENYGIFEKYYVIGTFSINEIKGDMNYKIIAYTLFIFSFNGICEVFTDQELLYMDNFKIVYEHPGYCNLNEDVFFAIGTCDNFY